MVPHGCECEDVALRGMMTAEGAFILCAMVLEVLSMVPLSGVSGIECDRLAGLLLTSVAIERLQCTLETTALPTNALALSQQEPTAALPTAAAHTLPPSAHYLQAPRSLLLGPPRPIASASAERRFAKNGALLLPGLHGAHMKSRAGNGTYSLPIEQLRCYNKQH